MTTGVILDNNKSPVDIALERFRAAQRNYEQLQSVPDPEWLIDKILPKTATAVLWGESGIGKSFVSLDWSLSLACGVNWFGHKIEQTNVTYIYGEGHSGMKLRANAWVAEHDATPEEEMLWVGRMLKPFERPQLEAIKQLAGEHNAGLVVIDTLARAMAGHSENDSLEMGRMVEAAEELRDDLNATILFVHHANASSEKKMRGSSALKGAIDTELQLEQVEPEYPDSIRELQCRKQKDSKPFRMVPIHFKEVEDSVVLSQYHPRPLYPSSEMLYA